MQLRVGDLGPSTPFSVLVLPTLHFNLSGTVFGFNDRGDDPHLPSPDIKTQPTSSVVSLACLPRFAVWGSKPRGCHDRLLGFMGLQDDSYVNPIMFQTGRDCLKGSHTIPGRPNLLDIGTVLGVLRQFSVTVLASPRGGAWIHSGTEFVLVGSTNGGTCRWGSTLFSNWARHSHCVTRSWIVFLTHCSDFG